jgi:hypothetical protein
LQLRYTELRFKARVPCRASTTRTTDTIQVTATLHLISLPQLNE